MFIGNMKNCVFCLFVLLVCDSLCCLWQLADIQCWSRWCNFMYAHKSWCALGAHCALHRQLMSIPFTERYGDKTYYDKQ